MDSLAPRTRAGARRRAPVTEPQTPAQELAAMKAYVAEITKSKEDSIALLQRAGILNSKGKLAKPYRA